MLVRETINRAIEKSNIIQVTGIVDGFTRNVVLEGQKVGVLSLGSKLLAKAVRVTGVTLPSRSPIHL